MSQLDGTSKLIFSALERVISEVKVERVQVHQVLIFVLRHAFIRNNCPGREQNGKMLLKCHKNTHNYNDVKLSQKMLLMRCIKMISFQ
jgi:hypothetical protein